MDVNDFAGYYPRLYHLAHADAWPGLQEHGLLSANRLLRLFEHDEADELVSNHRTEAVDLTHPEYGTAQLRDQGGTNMDKLEKALASGTSAEQWLRLLADVAFFFPTRAMLDTMLKTYGHEPVTVLTVNTASLVAEHGTGVRLSSINTGSVLYRPGSRGPDTFVSIQRFDHGRRTVKEVAVQGGVPDLMDHLWLAERWMPDGTKEPLHS